MMIRRTLALLSAALLGAALLAGCSEDAPTATNEVGTTYPDKTVGFQLEMPAAGEKIAIMHTSMGDMSIRFFPEAAPKAVENFIDLAEQNYYDGLTFHRVINDFMIQGGDPDGDGTGGESKWGKDFEDEFDQKLLNLRGSLAMANSGPDSNGSQFFINQAKADSFDRSNYAYDALYANYEQMYDMYASYYGNTFTKQYPDVDAFITANGGISPDSRMVPDEVWALYEENGGNINLDGAWRASGGHTVFGQVFEGLDELDAIAAVETDDNDKPVEDVTIDSIEIVEYQG